MKHLIFGGTFSFNVSSPEEVKGLRLPTMQRLQLEAS